jgi:hypothetical protein
VDVRSTRYDIALIEQVATYLGEHPPHYAMDADAYWAAFPFPLRG